MSFNHIVIQNIMRDKSTYISYYLSSVFSILVFFLFSIIAFHPMLKGMDSNSTLGLVMLIANFIIYIFSFLFIGYSMYAFLNKKTKSLGIFMITGASMKQVRTMIFRENIFISLLSIITAVVLGLIIAPLFLMIAKRLLQAEEFGMYIPFLPIGITLFIFSILFLILSKFMTRFINREDAIKLLKSDVRQDKSITYSPYKLILSLSLSGILLFILESNMVEVDSIGILYYPALFISILLSIYFVITQGMLVLIRNMKKSPSYFRKTNMVFVSGLKAKERSHAHMIYLLTVLLLGVFVCTSVLYSSYYSVEKNTEAAYPYSYQYISLPGNSIENEQKNIGFIEKALAKAGSYDAYYSEYKTVEDRRIAFMSQSDYNSLGFHPDIRLDNNEYFVAAGNEGSLPDKESIHEYLPQLRYAGTEERNILSTGLQNVYYIVPDKLYATLDYPVDRIYAYELEQWTDKINVVHEINKEIAMDYDKYLMTSKIQLYESEKYVKSIIFFIGFMLSLVFLSAAMSILYFYLQTSIEYEKEKYTSIRRIGFSFRELASIVTRELALLIFTPFVLSSLMLYTALFGMRSVLSHTFLQVTSISGGLFLLLFVISFFMIRRSYLTKLMD